MKVKCVICETIDNLKDHSIKAKQMRNDQSLLYLCKTCDQRIYDKTKKRHQTGNFKLFKDRIKKDPWFD